MKHYFFLKKKIRLLWRKTLFFPNETDENFSKYFKKSDIKKINEIINNQNKFYEIKNKHAYTKIINESSYNLRKLILQTWKLLKHYLFSKEKNKITLEKNVVFPQ